MGRKGRLGNKQHGGKRQRAPRSARFGASTSRSSTATRTRIAPDELDVKLMFRKTDKLINGLSGVVAKSFHTNSAYDVDPAVGSTETLGFDEYAQLYSYYRVIGYSYECTVINPTDYPILFSALNTNLDASVAGTNYTLYSTNPHCKSKLVSTIGSVNNHTFRGSHKLSSIVGSPAVETADSFRSVVSSSPSDLTWFTIAGESIGGADISFVYDFKIIMHVRFYGREVDLTLATVIERLQAIVDSRETLEQKKRLEFAVEKKKSQKSIGASSSQKN